MPTNVYKVGGCVYVHENGIDLDVVDFPTISYAGFKTEGDDVIIYNHMFSSVDASNSFQQTEHFSGVRIPISDVRSQGGTAIGSNTKSDVRTYLAGLMEL